MHLYSSGTHNRIALCPTLTEVMSTVAGEIQVPEEFVSVVSGQYIKSESGLKTWATSALHLLTRLIELRSGCSDPV